MPQKSGFFDTTADDPREYPSREFAEYFARFVGNGVFGGGEKLKVSASGKDMNVSINLGYGWINGYMYSVFDAPLVLPLQQATTQDRIDRIVLRLDVSTPVRAIRAIVLQGNPGTTPQVPVIVRTGDIYDLSLAQVIIKANTSTIQSHQITDERLNNQVCGIVTALITQADTTSIFNEFQSWLRTKTVEYQKQWDDFMKDIQDKGFATTQYVDQQISDKAAAKKHNHDASEITSGTMNAARLPLLDAVNSTSTQHAATANSVKIAYDEAQAAKQFGVDAKGKIVGAINAKKVPASTSDDWQTLANKIVMIETARGTTNLAPNFWASIYGGGKTVQGRFSFKDGLIYTGFFDNRKYGLRAVDYNGTIISEQYFGQDDYKIYGFNLGPIASINVIAYNYNYEEIQVYDYNGNMTHRIPHKSINTTSISDMIRVNGNVYYYEARNGNLFDSNGTIVATFFSGYPQDAGKLGAYFVDVNTLTVDFNSDSGTMRWNGSQWVVDKGNNNNSNRMEMYLAALAAR